MWTDPLVITARILGWDIDRVYVDTKVNAVIHKQTLEQWKVPLLAIKLAKGATYRIRREDIPTLVAINLPSMMIDTTKHRDTFYNSSFVDFIVLNFS